MIGKDKVEVKAYIPKEVDNMLTELSQGTGLSKSQILQSALIFYISSITIGVKLVNNSKVDKK